MLSSRQSSQKFISKSRSSASNSSRGIFTCTQTKTILCIVIAWLILTIITYQKIYNADQSRPSRKKGSIPQHHGEALNLFGHLNQKIKEQEQKLKDLGIDVDKFNLKPNKHDDTSPISNPSNVIKQKVITTTTTTTTKKPTTKPTEKKDEFPQYFDTDLNDSTLHDIQWIRDRMYYWKKGISKHDKSEAIQPTGQYLTFWTDCGGFNNIRMGFEYMIIVGYLTNRTVVLPPIEGWYLIDWGRRSRMNSKDSSGKSGYEDFFNFEHLNLEVRTVSTETFVNEMGDKLAFDAKYKAEGYFSHGMKDWRKYLNKIADEKDINMGWGPLAHILNWPSIQAVQKSEHKPDQMFRSNRDDIEYTERQKQLSWIHFPSCDKGDPGTSRDFRYLGQVATFVWFDDIEKDNDLKRMLRDHVHMHEEIFFYASLVVQKLGAFQYAALHIRRNELQYKESFLAAADSLKHIKPLLKENEVLYIATDEKDERFFQVMEKDYTVYRWKDFVTNGSAMYIDREIPRKYEGAIEMAICGMGRIFFGTDTSTFTAYITRLRGYFDAPDKSTYHHNEQWSGDLKKDSNKHHKLWGSTYMDEFPQMWEHIKGTY